MSNELAVRESGVAEVWRKSTDVAGVVREFVTKHAVVVLQGKRYVRVEGWQACANAYGYVASARDVVVSDNGVSAIGEVRRISDGTVIATAEGFVGEDEPVWSGGRDARGKEHPRRPEYARRAMAQTRAISRACRSAFAYVVPLIDANLQTTPAEEMFDVVDAVPVAASADVTAQLKASLAAQAKAPAAAPVVEGQVVTGDAVVPWGKYKGQPLSSIEAKDLGYYVKKARETLADDSKANFHAKERQWLAAVEAELAKRGPKASPPKTKRVQIVDESTDGPPPHSDEDAPTPF